MGVRDQTSDNNRRSWRQQRCMDPPTGLGLQGYETPSGWNKREGGHMVALFFLVSWLLRAQRLGHRLARSHPRRQRRADHRDDDASQRQEGQDRRIIYPLR